MPTIISNQTTGKVFLQFDWTDSGTPRTTRIEIAAQDTDSERRDRSVTVAQLLVQKITSMPGFTLTSAISVQEVTTDLLA